MSPMMKYLQLPSSGTKNKQPLKKSTRAMTGARVLTSAECLAIIKEKELKKKQQEEEKENRKRMREEKKKQREEEKKRKQEQKVQREKEREKQRVKKAEEKAYQGRGRARKTLSVLQPDKSASVASASSQPTRQSLWDCTNTLAARRQLDPEVQDTDKCCVCMQSYVEEVSREVVWIGYSVHVDFGYMKTV